MSDASQLLTDFGVPHEVEVVSAHRTPDKLLRYGREARARGLRAIIAGAGGAAHLPGMLASVTALPVIGVPVQLATLDGLDSLLSIVQMPAASRSRPSRSSARRTQVCSPSAFSGRRMPRSATGSSTLRETSSSRWRRRTAASRSRCERRESAAAGIRPQRLVEGRRRPADAVPDTSSREVMTRRGWWLVLLNFLVPGSAQAVAGNRRLGKIGLGATLGLWIAVILGGSDCCCGGRAP